MKKQLGILLLTLTVALGFSGTVSAWGGGFDNGFDDGTFFNGFNGGFFGDGFFNPFFNGANFLTNFQSNRVNAFAINSPGALISTSNFATNTATTPFGFI